MAASLHATAVQRLFAFSPGACLRRDLCHPTVGGRLLSPGECSGCCGEVCGTSCAANKSVASTIKTDGGGDVYTRTTQIGGEEQGVSGGRKLGHERILLASEMRLDGMEDGKISGRSAACDIRAAKAVHRNGGPSFAATAAEERGIEQAAAIELELGHKNVIAATKCFLECARSDREIGRCSITGNTCPAVGVQSDGFRHVVSRATQESGINQGAAIRREFGYKRVALMEVVGISRNYLCLQHPLERAGRRREISGLRSPGDECVKSGINGDPVAAAFKRSIQIGRIIQVRSCGVQAGHKGVSAAVGAILANGDRLECIFDGEVSRARKTSHIDAVL